MPREGDRFISDLFKGGPYQHRWQARDDGTSVCRVCGVELPGSFNLGDTVGCPAQGIPHADGTPLTGVREFEKAAPGVCPQHRACGA